MFGTLEGIFFVKYTTMLYQWQLVKNKVIQSNFPGNFHDKMGETPLSGYPHLHLQRSVRAFGTQLSPYFIN
jgi:hypothetical protein